MNEESIFAAAISIEQIDERQAYLDQACQEHPEIRERVDVLLSAHESNHRLVDQPIEFDATEVNHRDDRAIGPGTRIGRYKLLQEIGEGGFGVVYMAEQMEPVRRRVALKVIKPGMDSREVVARFEAERQALAMMDHPNIARVLDAGTTDLGHPYFVMELVKGVPITDYADQNKLPTRDRLKLFIQVCQAVQHAHQKGVIHRDLKPSNVMITLHDGVPVPKVIDFGVAKALNQQLTEKTLFTRYGQIIGTPQYMSPEQAEMSGLDVDTRSDVYSLGVLLYVLLAGKPPFDANSLREAGYDEMRRIIREQDPQKPSDRLRTLDAETATTVASSRSSQPRALTRFVEGELDWIVMRALEKNRERRFDSPGNFAAEIQRYLNGEAIETHAPSILYVCWKRFRRHQAAFLITGLVFVLVSAAAIISFVSYMDARRQRDLAQRAESTQASLNEQLRQEKQVAKNSFEMLVKMIKEVDPKVLKEFAENSQEIFAENPHSEYEMLDLILYQMMLSHLFSEEASKRYVELAKSRYGEASREHIDALAVFATNTDDLEQLETAIQLAKDNDLTPGFRTLSRYGSMLVKRERFDDAIEVLGPATDQFRLGEVKLPYMEIPQLWLGEARRCTGNEDAYQSNRDKGVQKLLGFYSDKTAEWWRENINFGVINMPIQAEWGYLCLKGIAQQEDVTSLSDSVSYWHNLAQSYRRKGQTKESYEAFCNDLRFREQSAKSDDAAGMGWSQCFIGRVFRNVGDVEKYEEYLRTSIDTLEQTDNPWASYWIKFELGFLLYHQGERDESLKLFNFVREKVTPFTEDNTQALWDEETDFCVYFFTTLAIEKEVDQETLDRADQMYKENKNQKLRFLRLMLAYNYLEKENYSECIRFLKELLPNKNFWDVLNEPANETFMFGKLFRSDQKAAAIDLFEQLVRARDKKMVFGHPQRGLMRLRGARLLIENDLRPDLARKYLIEAKKMLTGHEMLPEKYLVEIDTLLDQVEAAKTP